MTDLAQHLHQLRTQLSELTFWIALLLTAIPYRGGGHLLQEKSR
ncbi:MAG TPA: hypothetical protein VHN80_30395 [Kineosporiaceae bacterium]|nr:hypothetical protein [Kineosporiaceae bacterium]